MAQLPSLKQLAAQMKALEGRIAQLERKKLTLLQQIDAIDDEITALRGGRGPGRPPKRASGRARRVRRKGPGLTDFVRGKVKRGGKKVGALAAAAAKAGYESANLEQVIRLMVGKAADLTRQEDDTIVAVPGAAPHK